MKPTKFPQNSYAKISNLQDFKNLVQKTRFLYQFF